MSSQSKVSGSREPGAPLPPVAGAGGAAAAPGAPRVLAARAWARARSFDFRLRLAWALVAVFLLADVVLIGQHSVVRYASYHADAFDLGNMDQAVWNTLHGHPFRFTNRGVDWQGPPTRLGVHVEPILLLIAPLYLIHSGPETLLILQSVALALGGIPLFLLARRRLPDLPLVGAAFVAAYYLTPQLLGEALWDFHAVTLATPLLLVAIWALDARRYGWFAVSAALAAFTKEDVALAVIPLGLFIWIYQGRPRLGQAVAALAALWTALCFFVILPHFNGGAAGGNYFWQRYSWLGASAGAATVNLATHPWLLIGNVLGSAARRGYIASLLRIGGGLGVFAPLIWIAGLPELAINLLSTHPEQYSSFFQYNAMLIAFLMAGGVYGAAHLLDVRRRAERGEAETSAAGADASAEKRDPVARVALGLHVRLARLWDAGIRRIPVRAAWIAPLLVAWLALTTAWSFAFANVRVADFWAVGSGPIAQQDGMDRLLAAIPADASVAATDTLNPHLSDRYTLYLMPDPLSYTAEYVAVDIPDAAAEYRAADAIMYQRMRASGRYEVIGAAYDIVILKRIGPPLDPPPPALSSQPPS